MKTTLLDQPQNLSLSSFWTLLSTYLDLQNIFDSNNEWDRVYLNDGTIEMAYQYKQLWIGGIIIEF